MNLKFNDKSDIDYNDKVVGYLKEKQDIAANYFSIVRLYNYLTKNKDYILSFSASQITKNFHGVHWSSGVGTSGFENLKLQSDDFVPALAKNDKIDSETERFSHTFKSTKESALNFIKICAYPECVDEFLSKYKNQIDIYAHLGDKVEKEEYKVYDDINSEYVDAVYHQDVKKLYYMLEAFKYIADQSLNYEKVAINFERGFNVEDNVIKSISFIADKSEETFSWTYPITFRMSNMLAKDGNAIDIEDVNNAKHVLLIENNPEGWVKFDKSILDSYYDEFSKVCLHSQLNNDFKCKKSVKSLKI